jgi:hypothetical protein
LTLLIGAVLLFSVQPLAGRLLLPHLGGSPAVWNTCLVFFQGILLLGYLYSHLTTRHLGLKRQAILHLALLAVVVPTLPIAAAHREPPIDAPALWLLGTLFLSVGLPFFVVSTTSPLLQRWYGATRARGAADPYFLSVASNLGSLLALLAYPLAIEPALRLSQQSEWWRWGYVIYALLVASCAGVVLMTKRSDCLSPPFPLREGGPGGLGLASASADLTPQPPSLRGEGEPDVTRSPVRWIILAFVPSSLLVGVTNAITIDIAPIPLLWVIPLSLYLLTFIVAFAPRVRLPLGLLGKGLSMCALFLGLALLAGATEPLWLVLPLHLVTFFAASLVCHGRLAAGRPSVEHLTSFYLWMSFGGVLGGAFNALVAPIVFQRLGYVEYPLALLAVCLLRPVSWDNLRPRWTDLIAPMCLGLFAAALVLGSRAEAIAAWLKETADGMSLDVDLVRRAACFGLPLILNFLLVERPVRFALGLGALFLAGGLDPGAQGRVLHLERSFLGVVKVTESPDGQFTRMVHGNTVHGQQRRATRPEYSAAYLQTLGASSALNELSILAVGDGRWDDRHRPLTYYYPNGPAGIVFRYLVDGWNGPRRIGAVGLGTGAIASYARTNQDWTFFELDPAVERLAHDERYFTYLRDSAAKSMTVVIGDARLKLANEPDASFDLLVLDAFSSDAIPIHLLTAEAFGLYERKLAPNGVILMHLSNRYLDLPPVVKKIAETATPPLVVRMNDDIGISDREKDEGKFPSIWVIVARNDEDFGPLRRPIRGFLTVPASESPRWTDDRADLLRAFRRNEE